MPSAELDPENITEEEQPEGIKDALGYWVLLEYSVKAITVKMKHWLEPKTLNGE